MAKKPISAEHKAALAEGRKHGRAVRAYLEGLESNRPKRGRKRTKESITARLDTIHETIEDVDPIIRLSLAQERLDLNAELEKLESGGVDMGALETDFIASAAAYGESKGITYAAWREVGVAAETLKKAGISR